MSTPSPSPSTLAPTADTASYFAALSDANYHIDLYIASIEFLPTSIPMSGGRDLMQLLHLTDALSAAKDHNNSYVSNVGTPLRTLRDQDLPACNTAYAAFVSVYDTVPALTQGQPLAAAERQKLTPAVQSFLTPLQTLHTHVDGISATFTQFHDDLVGDMQTIGNLATIFHPEDPGGIVAQLKLSSADVTAAQQAITENAPSFAQDVGVAVTQAGAMLTPLSQVTDAFQAVAAKVDGLISTLQQATDPDTPAILETLNVQNAKTQWQQLDRFVSQLGF